MMTAMTTYRSLLLPAALAAILTGCATPGANPAADIRVPTGWGQHTTPTEQQSLQVTAPATTLPPMRGGPVSTMPGSTP